MLRLLLGTDWTANRERILTSLAQDVKQGKGNRILIVPELISHEAERQLCQAAGDTASRYAEVVSFTRLARRVSDWMHTPLTGVPGRRRSCGSHGSGSPAAQQPAESVCRSGNPAGVFDGSS